MPPSFTSRALFGGVILSVLALSGCGSDDGDDAVSAATQTEPTFDGTGSEVLGYYVAVATQSSGIYAGSGHYAPVGLSRRFRLYISDGTLYLDSDNTTTSLAANTGTQTYEGTGSWMPSSGLLSGSTIDEDWSVSFAGSTVTLAVSGSANAGADTGSTTWVLHPIVGVDYEDNDYFLGRNVSHSGDSRFVDGSASLEIYDDEPGTYGYWAPDATWGWYDYYYFDAFYRDGDLLKAGGFVSNSGYLSNDREDLFAAITVQLDSLGRPIASVGTVQDYDQVDVDSLTDVEPTSFTVVSNDYKSEVVYDALYAYTSGLDLTVTSVTAGGQLEANFGTTLSNAIQYGGEYLYIGGLNTYFYGGYVSPTVRRMVAWDGRYRDYFNDNVPGYDLDDDNATEDRVTITLDYDATTLPATPTGGTIKLELYDNAGTLTSTENMAFTLASAP